MNGQQGLVVLVKSSKQNEVLFRVELKCSSASIELLCIALLFEVDSKKKKKSEPHALETDWTQKPILSMVIRETKREKFTGQW